MTNSSPTARSIDLPLLKHIVGAANAVLENAVALHDEAQLLGAAGCNARSLLLHQISLEECGKIELLAGFATGILMHEKLEPNALFKRLRQHEAKNSINAYMLEATPEEREAKQKGYTKTALEAFDAMKEKFHEDSNNSKNAALYVDIGEETVNTPADTVTVQMRTTFAARNQEFLAHMHLKVELLYKFLADPSKYHAQLSKMLGSMQAWKKSPPDNIEKALMEMLNDSVKG